MPFAQLRHTLLFAYAVWRRSRPQRGHFRNTFRLSRGDDARARIRKFQSLPATSFTPLPPCFAFGGGGENIVMYGENSVFWMGCGCFRNEETKLERPNASGFCLYLGTNPCQYSKATEVDRGGGGAKAKNMPNATKKNTKKEGLS
jgi:hypothetical protein